MIRPITFPAVSRDEYPTSDGRPMGETDVHRDLILALLGTLRWWFRDDPTTYVSGNLLVFYDKGNKWAHVSPDVLVVPGAGSHARDNYLLWEEGRGLDVVIELTSKTTMAEDIEKKYDLYVSKLGVKEYFLFDPREEYLTPPFQGYRRVKGRFQAIKPVTGRFPSKVLGLHLERSGTQLRLWDPSTGEWVPTPDERAAIEAERADQEKARADDATARADAATAQAARLQRELDALRRKLGGT